MADFLNTPILSRRTALAGMAAFTAAPAIAETPETDIATRTRQWHIAEKEVPAAFDRAAAMSDALSPRPEMPEELATPFKAADGRVRSPRDHWDTAWLDALIRRGGWLGCEDTETADTLSFKFETVALAPGEMERAKKLRGFSAEYDVKIRKYLDDADRFRKEAEDLCSKSWDDGIAIIATPASCIADVAHKVSIVRKLDLVDGGTGEQADEALQMLFTDIERLAGFGDRT